MRNKFLWVIPFISFIIGYGFIRICFNKTFFTAPSLVGLSVENACAILSEQQISMQILQYKIDADIPHNTVISQTPGALQKIRPHQTIFLTVSLQQPAKQAPSFYQKKKDAIDSLATSLGLKASYYYLPFPFYADHCFAQYPHATHNITSPHLILYMANPTPELIIWPSFIHKKLEEVIEFLNTYKIEPHISYPPLLSTDNNKAHTHCLYVVDQRPLAGTLIAFKAEKPPLVQLKVSEKQPAV